jgi:hypothetical protein
MVGGSVANARAAKVSMIKLTHRSCTAVSADSSSLFAMDETKAKTTAVTLTVSWNYNYSRNTTQYLKELLDRVTHGAAPHNCLHDRSKIIIHEDDR